MKFPLPRNIFPPLDFTAQEVEEYEALAKGRVDSAVREYDRFVQTDNRKPRKTTWKQVKSRGNVVVYKDITGLDRQNDELPPLLMVGTFRGTLDDVMYGLAAPDSSTMRLKASYLHDDIADSAVLYQMQGPSQTNPFHFLGIKWSVLANKVLAKPRDYVVLESTGIIDWTSGSQPPQRIGYHFVQSVDVPGCRELDDRGISRSRTIMCFLYKQCKHGMVEVYMRARVQHSGHGPEGLAVKAAADDFLQYGRAVDFAQNKKLSYLVQNNHQNRDSSYVQPRQNTMAADPRHSSKCGRCFKGFGAFSSGSTCQLCYLTVCFRCRMSRKLGFECIDGLVMQTPMFFCQHCLESANKENALEVARQEVLDGKYTERSRARGRSTASTLLMSRSRLLSSARGPVMTSMERSSNSARMTTSSQPEDDRAPEPGQDRPHSTVGLGDWRLRTASSAKKLGLPPTLSRETTSTTASSLADSESGLLSHSVGPDDVPSTSSRELRGTRTNSDEVPRTSNTSNQEDEEEQDAENEEEEEDEAPLLNDLSRNLRITALDYVGHYDYDSDDMLSRGSSIYAETEARSSLCSSIAVLDYHDDHRHFSPAKEGDEEGYEDQQPQHQEEPDEEDGDDEWQLGSYHMLAVAVDDGDDQAMTMETISAKPGDPDAPASPVPGDAPRSSSTPPRDLYAQISELRDAAENIYQLTKRNTETLLSSGRMMSDHDLFPVETRSERAQSQGSEPFRFEELD